MQSEKASVATSRQTIDGRLWLVIIEAMASAIELESEALDALDSTVGDGDHGYNMTSALAAAAEQCRALAEPAPATVLETAGTAIMNAMGGASGIVFGAFFRGGGRAVAGLEALALADVEVMLAAGLAEVQRRGRAQPGDKSLVDALAPALAAVRQASAAGLSLPVALAAAAAAARAGAQKTQQMVAAVGRARMLGERSLGHQDAGATSMALMMQAWAESVAEEH